MSSQPPDCEAAWRGWIRDEWLLLFFGLLAAVLAVLDPQPLARYRQWLQLPTLAGLAGLMIAIQGIRDSGMVQRAAARLLARAHALRSLGLLLVTITALLSMVLTNDVSLFLLVPVTVAIGGMSNLPVLRMVVLEALAVNVGSALSPIGNPQNLLMWQSAHLPFFSFVSGMLPASATMFALLVLLTLAWLPKGRVTLQPEALDGQALSRPLAALSLVALVSMVVMMEHGLALTGALSLLLPFALLARDSLRRLDWPLLATFAAIFLGGIVASQLISNVPATVLLLSRAGDPMALAVAVNVGGFGVVIGSLANLIALRLARQTGGMRLLHLVSVPFLLAAAPLVYLAWRWLG